MRNRQIVFTKAYTAELVENVIPDAPRSGEVLIKTIYTAVSAGTERANFIGETNISPIREKCGNTFPRKLGYCGVGIAEAVAPDVKSVAVGQRVIINFGKHSEYNLVPEAKAIPVIDEALSNEDLSLLVIASFSAEGIRKTRLEFGESVAVIGAGILGLFSIMLARAAGAVPVIAVDPNAAARERALQYGADYALDPTEDGFVEKTRGLTHGGVNVTVEASGNSAALNKALLCCAPMGRVTLLGCTRTPDAYDLYHDVHFPGVSLIGAHTMARPNFESYPGNWTAKDDIQALMRLISLGRIEVKSLISEIHSPTEAQSVYDRLANDRAFPIGVLFDWRKL